MRDPLIFGKDQTDRVVSVEPGPRNLCRLFIQSEDGSIGTKDVPLTHWLIYTERHSPKMTELDGSQPYKWLIEYADHQKYQETLKASYRKRLDFYKIWDPKEAFMVKNGVTQFKGLKVKDVSILSFDLEHTYGIGDTLRQDGKLLLISNTFRDSFGVTTKRLFSFDEFVGEGEMLAAWCQWVREMDPSIVAGHNLFGHDFKILAFASKKCKAPLNLGRDKSSAKFDNRTSNFRKDGSQSYKYNNVLIYGREIVDTFFLAIKYDVMRNYESYGLKAIVKHEGLEKVGRVHYDASQILSKFEKPEEWEKIKAYAIDDADDSLALYDLMIPSFFYLAQSIPRSLQHIINSATGGWINSFLVRSYLQLGHSIAKASELPEHTEGGISFAVPGIYKNMYKVDLKSAYPSQVLRFKLYDKDKDPNGHFLHMVEYFFKERFDLKKKYEETGNSYFKHRDSSSKVFLNSAYGVTITNKLNYNSPAIGAKITEETRNMIDMALVWASGKNRTYWIKLFKERTGNAELDEVS